MGELAGGDVYVWWCTGEPGGLPAETEGGKGEEKTWKELVDRGRP